MSHPKDLSGTWPICPPEGAGTSVIFGLFGPGISSETLLELFPMSCPKPLIAYAHVNDLLVTVSSLSQCYSHSGLVLV